MNLAQCIDPEWVQHYFGLKRPARAQVEAPHVEPRLPKRGRPSTAAIEAGATSPSDRIREALACATGAHNALTLADIRELVPGFTPLQLATNLGGLRKNRQVERAGDAGEYRYFLTDAGREKLLES